MSSPDPSSADDRRRSATHVLLSYGAERDLDLDVIGLPGDVEHHLARVLRLRDGATVSVTDGNGRWRLATWRPVPGALEASSDVATDEGRVAFTLATAIPKGDRVDVLVQKATELGVGRIVFLHADRSVVRWKPERADKQIARLARIADESVRQSRRVWRVEVDGPVASADVLASAAVAEPGGSRFQGDEDVVAIGPEGGWSDEELRRATRLVSLGSGVLRVETAGITACALRMALGH